MKKRNKYFLLEKQYLKLKNDLSENWKAQRALGYVLLDVPIHKGYNAYLTLRNDISNREDAWIFQTILDTCGSSSWWRKDYKKTPPKKFAYESANPHIRNISERVYDAFPIQVRKYFSEDKITYNNVRWYYCNVPRFFFDVAVEKYYQTRIRIIDEVLLQEEAEIYEELESAKYRGLNQNFTGAPKAFVKHYNKRYKEESKRITKHNQTLLDENEYLEYSIPGRRSAAWDWW